MIVSIVFQTEEEEYGFNGTVAIVRDGIEDLTQLANLYTEATKAAGWDYVASVGFEKDDGNIVFGDI